MKKQIALPNGSILGFLNGFRMKLLLICQKLFRILKDSLAGIVNGNRVGKQIMERHSASCDTNGYNLQNSHQQ